MQEAHVENNKTSTNCKAVGRFKHVCKYRQSKRFTGSTVRSQPRASLEIAHLPFLLHPVQKNNLNRRQVTDKFVEKKTVTESTKTRGRTLSLEMKQ